jgi:hypothetical protein
MTKDSDQEYAEVCLTLRHYSGLRFGMRTLFLAILVGLAVVGFGIIPQQSFLVKSAAKAFGLLMTAFFWVSEKNAARYMSHLQERASQLEKALGYRLWSAMPKAAYGFFRGAFIVPLVYASIALFWIYALISIR